MVLIGRSNCQRHRESVLFQTHTSKYSMGAEGNDITAPSLAVEDRLCHSAARRALPTKRIHSNAVSRRRYGVELHTTWWNAASTTPRRAPKIEEGHGGDYRGE